MQAHAAPMLDIWRLMNRQPFLEAPAMLSAAAAVGLVPCPFTGAYFTRRAPAPDTQLARALQLQNVFG